MLQLLGGDVDARQPAAVAWVGVVPADYVFLAGFVTALGEVLDEVLVGFALGVDAGLGALDGEAEGVGDDEGRAVDVALHDAHDLERAAGAGVHDHFDEGHGGDADGFEVVRVGHPRAGFAGLGLRGGGVVEEGVALAVDQLVG